MSYVYDTHIFHYVVENGICYLCMSDELRKHRIPYAFLQDMKQRFVARYGSDIPQTAIAFSMNDEFAHVIQERMNFYNSDEADHTVDNIGAVKSQIEDVKGVMVENIEKVLERGKQRKREESVLSTNIHVLITNYATASNIHLFPIKQTGEKIELLVDKTDRLNQQAFKFESSSRNLRRTLYWRKMRGYVVVGVAITVLLYLAMVSLCGGFGMKKCFSHN